MQFGMTTYHFFAQSIRRIKYKMLENEYTIRSPSTFRIFRPIVLSSHDIDWNDLSVSIHISSSPSFSLCKKVKHSIWRYIQRNIWNSNFNGKEKYVAHTYTNTHAHTCANTHAHTCAHTYMLKPICINFPSLMMGLSGSFPFNELYFKSSWKMSASMFFFSAIMHDAWTMKKLANKWLMIRKRIRYRNSVQQKIF